MSFRLKSLKCEDFFSLIEFRSLFVLLELGRERNFFSPKVELFFLSFSGANSSRLSGQLKKFRNIIFLFAYSPCFADALQCSYEIRELKLVNADDEMK